MKPFRPADVYCVNDELKINTIHLEHGDKVLIIDGFYKNPDLVRELCLSTPVPIWKNTKVSKNGDEYWDCRHQWLFFDESPFFPVLTNLIEAEYGVKIDRKNANKSFVTNVFKWNSAQPKNSVGNVPHFDSIKYIAANIYLNIPGEEHGGTALYSFKNKGSYRVFNSDMIEMRNHPEKYMHLAENGDSYYLPEWDKYWELYKLLPMKYNRLVIYPGYIFHGAYHVNNAFSEYPRLTQTCFLPCEDVPNCDVYYAG